ncbi:MarR family winged helix-turn-helix transcriptional regulator [Microlunatus flavus]|uniref:DNA-binding transcriptional regulator, MarR family n=1 Tax=Microlunatus flavus TaxID=1036181 RepID=A0A1H9L6X7_9ACTN|nr:MarR family transcriptional regulator [Microlunatus flavus]SER06907.1 DNA-binding transcriptional regulator, MarR family [Microlunatus flavus]
MRTADPPLADHTVYLLSQLGRHGRRRLTARLADQGLTMLDMAALAVLEQSGPLPHTELARRLGLDPSDVTAQVEEMLERRRVTRSVDPQDRRRRLVQMSPLGKDALERARQITQGVDDELLAMLPEETRLQLHATLRALLVHARTL